MLARLFDLSPKYRVQHGAVDTARSNQNPGRDAKPKGRDAMPQRQLNNPLTIL